MTSFGIKKLYYSISEVSKAVDEEAYVLRYWETEFDRLKPQKNRAGNRVYTEKDIQLLRAIKFLLRQKRYTIEGAREAIDALGGDVSTVLEELETYSEPESSTSSAPFSTTPSAITDKQSNDFSREELCEIRDMLQIMLAMLEDEHGEIQEK